MRRAHAWLRYEGWLQVVCPDVERLERRWAVLRLGVLSFYQDESLVVPLETHDLSRRCSEVPRGHLL